jgi:hypothetical protein
MKVLFHMRIEEEDLKRWRAAAVFAKVTLSEWIRGRCNVYEIAACKHGMLFCKKCK